MTDVSDCYWYCNFTNNCTVDDKKCVYNSIEECLDDNRK